MNSTNAIRFIFSLLLVAVISTFTRIPVGKEPEIALLRMNWHLTGEQVTKSLSQEEIDELPIHMKPADGVVERIALPYRLTLSIDGQTEVEQVVLAAGVRQDRPMYVLQDFELSPGTHRFQVTFAPIDGPPEATAYHIEREMEFKKGQIISIGLERENPEMFLY